jgi:hypothetical protein
MFAIASRSATSIAICAVTCNLAGLTRDRPAPSWDVDHDPYLICLSRSIVGAVNPIVFYKLAPHHVADAPFGLGLIISMYAADDRHVELTLHLICVFRHNQQHLLMIMTDMTRLS